MTNRDDLLKELASAWRLDWSNFDGRILKMSLEEWLELPQEVPEPAALGFRATNGLCLSGGGHWRDFCGKLPYEDC